MRFIGTGAAILLCLFIRQFPVVCPVYAVKHVAGNINERTGHTTHHPEKPQHDHQNNIQNDQFFRNRLTHSLEVAQIARSIANELRYTSNEIFVVEAGSLAHDIGNPPFGHAGESELDKIFCKVGGFEGNAQALRILTSLEKKKPDFRGLNLTYRTLLSIVKYFNKKQGNNKTNKKFIYDEDYDLLKSFISENHITIRTLDVQIVDLADEIAYAAHDLEDGLRVKAFIIDEILHDYHSKYGDTEKKLGTDKKI